MKKVFISLMLSLFCFSCHKEEVPSTRPDTSDLAKDIAAYPNQQRGVILLSEQEYKAIPQISTPAFGGRISANGRVEALPAAVDLSSEMPPVGNQGAQGSCVGWSVGYALRSYLNHYVTKSGYLTGETVNNQAVFSPAFIYNQLNGGKDEGSHISSALKLMLANGAATMADMPYSDKDYRTQPTTQVIGKAAGNKIKEFGRISLDLPAFKAFLANKNPIVIGAKVDANMTKLTDKFDNEPGWRTYDAASVRGGHAMVIVGYDDARQAFKVQNSWGSGWGNKGFFWMAYSLLPYIQEAYAATVTGKDFVENTVNTSTLNDAIYFGSEDYNLYALDAQTTKIRWQFKTQGQIYSAPLYYKGMVYAVAAEGTNPNKCRLYAIDAQTGKEKWFFDNALWDSPVTVSGGKLFVNTRSGKIVALDPAAGTQKQEFEASVQFINAINGRLLGIGSETFICFDANTGTKKWQTNSNTVRADASLSTVSVADGLVYRSLYDKSDKGHKVIAYALETGEKKWETKIAVNTAYDDFPHSPVYANGLVYITYFEGLIALDAKSGNKKWEFTDTYHDAPSTRIRWNNRYLPAISNGSVFITNGNYVFSIDGQTGKRQWRFVEPYHQFTVSVTAANGIVYASSPDYGDGIYAIDAVTGSKLWNFKVAKATQPCIVDKKGNIFRGSLGVE